jgi:hypothetical protein
VNKFFFNFHTRQDGAPGGLRRERAFDAAALDQGPGCLKEVLGTRATRSSKRSHRGRQENIYYYYYYYYYYYLLLLLILVLLSNFLLRLTTYYYY